MKHPADSERLLDAVLAEAVPEEFRAALLEQTLRCARRRRRVVVIRKGVIAVLLLSLGAWWWSGSLVRTRPPVPIVRHSAPAHAVYAHAVYGVVQSHAPTSSMLVETRHGTTAIVSSAGVAIGIVETRPGQRFFNEIGDDQLLSLLSGRPAALIRQGPGRAELVMPHNGSPLE